MKVYEVEINGIIHKMLLSDEDAKARGLVEAKPAQKKAAPKPANKARAPKNKS